MTNDVRIEICRFADHAAGIKQVREEVFIDEQHVPVELEWDGLDNEAVHAIALTPQDQKIIATGRLLNDGHIGRMAVLKPWRGKHIGSAILNALVEVARQAGQQRIFLYAQTSAVNFYIKHGFKPEGEVFMDAGIPHLPMEYSLK